MKETLGSLELNRIYQFNCVEGMKLLPNECVDLTITSPPYDDIRDYKGFNFNSLEVAEQLYRITKKGGVVVWVVGDRTVKGSETGTSFKQALDFMASGFNLHDTMIYMKDSIAFPDTNRYYQIFEYMFVFSKSKPKTFNLIKDRENKHVGKKLKGRERQPNGTLKQRYNVNEINKYGIRYNVWQYQTGYMKHTKDKEAYNHPAIFPEKLAEDHIISWSNENEIVFDPFMGSGTTAKMAQINNRKWLGFEVASDYIEIANKRLDNLMR